MNEMHDQVTVAGAREECGRYVAVEGERALVLYRYSVLEGDEVASSGSALVDRLVDHPHPNEYLVAADVEQGVELRRLVDHYLRMVDEHAVSPMEMSTEEILLLRPRL